MVGLPVLQGSGEEDYLRLYRNGLALRCAHVADEKAFGQAAAYARKSLASVPEANCVLGEAAGAECAEIRSYFQTAGTAPLAWYFPADTRDGAAFGSLQARELKLFRLAQMADRLPQTHAGLTIISARASFPHVAQIAPQMHPQAIPAEAAEAEFCHLDDARVDSLIALSDQVPVAYGSVLSVGDAGVITDLFVIPSERGRGYGLTMTARLLDICTRSLFRDVLLPVCADDARSLQLARAVGFAEVATLVQYEAVSA